MTIVRFAIAAAGSTAGLSVTGVDDAVRAGPQARYWSQSWGRVGYAIYRWSRGRQINSSD